MCLTASSRAGPLGVNTSNVAAWDITHKLMEAGRRTTGKLPVEMRAQFAALFTAESAVITGTVLTAWAISHAFGVGEAVDLILAGAAVVTMGWQAFQGGRELGNFLRIGATAQNERDLDEASTHLARAVIALGVVTITALIMRAGGRAKPVAAASSSEAAIMNEVRGILSSPGMAQIRAANSAGIGITVKIGGRLIQYEPGLPASGMTMFGEDGFILGREAFRDEAELTKTLLHELYRLGMSARGALGDASSMQEVITAETEAAAGFAERAYNLYFSRPK
jgi:hypothetical protein